MRKLSNIILVSLLFVACKKPHTLEVSVNNSVTGEAMDSVNIYIIEETNKVDAIGTITHDFYNGYTNNEGLLNITDKFDKRYTYKVAMQTTDKTGSGLYSAVEMHPDKNDTYWKNGVHFKIAPFAFLKLSIHNINCQGASDTMVLYETNLNVPDFYLQKGWPFAGCTNFEQSDFAKVPMGSIELKQVVTRAGVTNTYYDTVYLAEGQYKTYTINY